MPPIPIDLLLAVAFGILSVAWFNLRKARLD
jgi:predicted outer membrane lipoprotein